MCSGITPSDNEPMCQYCCKPIRICTCGKREKYADEYRKEHPLVTRPSWETTFLAMAEAAADRSSCLKLHVGAVLVKDHKVIATGYNGAPSGMPHCEECIRLKLGIKSGEQYELCESIHAEMNCLLQAGERAKDSDIYIVVKDPVGQGTYLRYPCFMCSKFLVQIGVRKCYVKTPEGFESELVKTIYKNNRKEKGMN